MSKVNKVIASTLLIFSVMIVCVMCTAGCKATNNKTIGIIAAMEEEVAGVKEAIQNPETINAAGSEYSKGKIGNFDVVVTKCGVGKVSASISAQYMIDQFHPDFIINGGSAGAISPNLKVGDIVVADKTAEWDMDTTSFGDPRGFIRSLNGVYSKANSEIAEKLAKNSPENTNVVKGLIVSSDQFVDKESQRATILQNFPDALCAEMEGAAIGHVCTQNNVPFCIIRCISDTADGNSGVDFNNFIIETGKKAATNMINFLNTHSPSDIFNKDSE